MGCAQRALEVSPKVCGSLMRGAAGLMKMDKGRCDWCAANIGTVPIVDPDGQELWICDWCDEEMTLEQMCLKR